VLQPARVLHQVEWRDRVVGGNSRGADFSKVDIHVITPRVGASRFLVAGIHSHSPKLNNAKSSAVISANFSII
jgi:hypothetical protein